MLGTVCLAGLVRGFTGFGSAMVMAPIFVLYLSPAESVASVLMLDLIVSLQLLPGAFRDVNWRLSTPLGLSAWLTTPLGLWLVLIVDKDLMRHIVAIFVLTFVLILYRGWRYKGRPNLFASMVVGGLSGLAAATTSMGGPPAILYLLSNMENVRSFRATIIVFFFLVSVPVVFGLALGQVINGETLYRIAALAPPFMIAAWLSSKFVRFADEKLFRRVALAILTVIALSVLFV